MTRLGLAASPLTMNRIPWDKILTFTPLDLGKLVISALIIVLVNKVQLVNDRLSALLIALPLTSLIAMMWMKQAGQSPTRLANHAEGTFWFVLPTLPISLMCRVLQGPARRSVSTLGPLRRSGYSLERPATARDGLALPEAAN